MKVNKNILLKRINELCDSKHIKPNTAFTESGVGKNFKSNLTSSNPSEGKITMLANYFGVSVDYLIGKTDDPTAPELKSNASDTLPLTVTQHNAINTQPEQSEPLTEQEKTILRLFRETTEEGRMRMIQSILNIHDGIKKSSASGENSNMA